MPATLTATDKHPTFCVVYCDGRSYVCEDYNLREQDARHAARCLREQLAADGFQKQARTVQVQRETKD